MKRLWAAGPTLLLAIACGAPSTAVVSNSPAAATPSAESPPPSVASSTMPLSTLDFNCVLPVQGYHNAGVSAFVSFPTRSVTLAAESGRYYDRAISRWVPVGREAVSPDGLRYAFTEGWAASPGAKPRLHVVDAASGKELQVATMPDSMPYQVVDFTTTGIYLVVAFEGTAPGVWRFDPKEATTTKISDGYYPATGATWLNAVDPRGPHPQINGMSGSPAPNRIDRRDEAGAIKTWFYAPGYAVMWVAFAGAPAIVAYASKQESATAQIEVVYWLVDGPGHATRLAVDSKRPLDLAAGFSTSVADDHGIWIGGPSSLYLIRRNGAILRVLEGSAYPANGCA